MFFKKKVLATCQILLGVENFHFQIYIFEWMCVLGTYNFNFHVNVIGKFGKLSIHI